MTTQEVGIGFAFVIAKNPLCPRPAAGNDSSLTCPSNFQSVTIQLIPKTKMLSDIQMQRDAIVPPREFEEVYGGFVLSYRPQPTPDGRFMAYVIVSRHLEFVQTCAAVTPDTSSFASTAEAAQVGRFAGRHWVDTKAQRDASAPRSGRSGKTEAQYKTLKGARASMVRQHA